MCVAPFKLCALQHRDSHTVTEIGLTEAELIRIRDHSDFQDVLELTPEVSQVRFFILQ